MTNWNLNTSKRIEYLYFCLEKCFVIALLMSSEFTITKMINKAVVAIQNIHLYNQVILEWN